MSEIITTKYVFAALAHYFKSPILDQKIHIDQIYFEVMINTPKKLAHCLKTAQNVAFEFWYFPPIFVLLKLTCLVTLFDRKLQVFKISLKWTIFGIFN